MTVIINIDAGPILRVATRFRSASAKFPKAIVDGLNEGGDRTRTVVRRALHKQMGTKKYAAIVKRTRTVRAHGGAMVYRIIGEGKGLPIREFKASVRRGPGGGVTGFPWAVQHKFKRSFSIGGGPDGFRARTTSKRFPIRKLYGPSVPKEMVKGAVPGAFYRAAGEFVPPAILKRIARILIG